MTNTTTQQAEWLKAHDFKMTCDDDGTIEVTPTNADVWEAPYYRVRQWYGRGTFELTHVYIRNTFDFPSPAGTVVSRHATLRDALRALLAA